MAMIPVIKYTLNKPVLSMKSTDDKKDDEKSEKKLTVLESHGYILGKTIGAGSYATVKVMYSKFHFLLNAKFPSNLKYFFYLLLDRKIQ